MLLAVLALLAAVGTFRPAERFSGLGDIYSSPIFVSLLILFSVNIAFCTWHRFSLYRKTAAKKTGGSGRGLRVTLDVLVHLSVIIILLGGAAKGLLSAIATQYLFVDVRTDTVYDWGVKADVPLGFTLLLKERVEDYYPLRVRVGVSDAVTGEKLALLEVREGKTFGLPGGDLRLSIGDHDIDGHWIDVRAEAGGRRETARLEIVRGGRTSVAFQDYDLTLVGWHRDLKRVRGRVAVLDGGEKVKEQWLAPNGRIGYGGTSIFMTAWGEDESRGPYIGIQATRDPGAFLFWIGATLLAVTLPAFILVRHRGHR